MTHNEYIRIQPDADSAMLFIHGILGTPNHFEPLLPLVPESMSVYNLLLEGHGKGAQDFGHSSMRKWEAQVEKAVHHLSASHSKIYIIAHSMGTLFAIEQAISHKKISGLFLMAVPILPRPAPRLLVTAARLYFGKIRPDDKMTIAAQRACSITLSKNPLHYIGWIPRYLELFDKVRKTRGILSELAVSATAFQSQSDEMVSARSIQYLKKHSGMIVHTLASSGHHYYSPDDLAFLKNEFLKFACKNRPGH